MSYARDVAPLVERHCLGCHSVTRTGVQRAGATPGVDLDTYDDVRRWADNSNGLIQEGLMPPRRGAMTAAEKATFQAWVDGGLAP